MTTEAQWLDLTMAEPPEGAVVRLRVSFPGSPITYTYIGTRIKNHWYLTGQDTGPHMWASLLRWLQGKHAELVGAETATAWESM